MISVSATAQTNMDEYNYLTKGYKIQLESGLDMKKGYTLKEYGTWGTTYSKFERNATFYGLFRDNETVSCAVLMILRRTNTDYLEYICIPHINSEKPVWDKAFNDWQASTEEWEAGTDYSWGMLKFISYQFSNK